MNRPELRLAWARLRADVDCGLRRGGWYRVVQFTNTEAVLDIQRCPVPVPRQYLEVSFGWPRRWSVVSRPPDAQKLPPELGTPYAVCPACRVRAPLHGHPSNLECPRCQKEFAVAWEEGYLAPA